MKLSILGGGGVRMPAFVRAVLAGRPGAFDQICLFEPDATRRATTARLAAEVAVVLGQPDVVTVTADAAEAFTGADYVFSAIRVGGDRGRVIDEQVALRRGIVGQETTGPGGCAMALRTIPVVLSYCELLSQCSPEAVLINFTNPAGPDHPGDQRAGQGAGGRRLRYPVRDDRGSGQVRRGDRRAGGEPARRGPGTAA